MNNLESAKEAFKKRVKKEKIKKQKQAARRAGKKWEIERLKQLIKLVRNKGNDFIILSFPGVLSRKKIVPLKDIHSFTQWQEVDKKDYHVLRRTLKDLLKWE